MKLVFLFGAGAVGKMTVGRALMAQTLVNIWDAMSAVEAPGFSRLICSTREAYFSGKSFL